MESADPSPSQDYPDYGSRLAVDVRVNEWVDQDCPQGGVLSLLLWKLVVGDLGHILNMSEFYKIAYVDDISVLID